MRSSLVSNSSSASFVILWKHNSFIGEPLDRIMDVMGYELHNNSIILGQSKLLEDGIIETSFFTGMMNDFSDFGIDAVSLYTLLSLNENGYYTLISAKVEHD